MSNFDDFFVAAGGSLQFITFALASNDATLEFSLSGGFEEYELHILDALADSSGVGAYLRTSTDGGSIFDSGASDYDWVAMGAFASGVDTTTSLGSTADTSIHIQQDVIGDTSLKKFSTTIKIIRPAESSFTNVRSSGNHYATGNFTPWVFNSSGQRRSAADVTDIQFFFSTANILSGLFVLYGVVTS